MMPKAVSRVMIPARDVQVVEITFFDKGHILHFCPICAIIRG